MGQPAAAKSGVAGQVLGVEQLMANVRGETTVENLTYIMHGLMLMVERLGGGNKLMAGRVFDEAMTSFLADFQAEQGEEMAAMAARLLIENIAIFLPVPEREAIQAALGGKP